MLRPPPVARPICPMCFEPGIHAGPQACIDNFRAEIDKLRTQIKHQSKDPAVEHLGRWVPSFTP